MSSGKVSEPSCSCLKQPRASRLKNCACVINVKPPPFAEILLAESVVMFFAIVLFFVSSLLCLADSQAPGDGNDTCINDPQHPVYDDYVHPLMDTRDYIQLLPNSEGKDGVWQALDKDENNPSGRKTEVIYM